VGTLAGGINSGGYRRINIECIKYYAHRLIWFYVKGTWPPGELDHKDGYTDHNKIGNLRPATRSQQCSNIKTRRDNRAGVNGVRRMRGKWQVRIQVGGHCHTLGVYVTKIEAISVRRRAEAKLFGEYRRVA